MLGVPIHHELRDGTVPDSLRRSLCDRLRVALQVERVVLRPRLEQRCNETADRAAVRDEQNLAVIRCRCCLGFWPSWREERVPEREQARPKMLCRLDGADIPLANVLALRDKPHVSTILVEGKNIATYLQIPQKLHIKRLISSHFARRVDADPTHALSYPLVHLQHTASILRLHDRLRRLSHAHKPVSATARLPPQAHAERTTLARDRSLDHASSNPIVELRYRATTFACASPSLHRPTARDQRRARRSALRARTCSTACRGGPG